MLLGPIALWPPSSCSSVIHAAVMIPTNTELCCDPKLTYIEDQKIIGNLQDFRVLLYLSH